jgi:DNA-binding HxlR family transcriptional regulator
MFVGVSSIYGVPGGCDAGPVQVAVRMIGGKWKLLILTELDTLGVLRFKELQRRLRPISQKALTRALRELQSDGLVGRTSFSEMPLRVEYRLTDRSWSLLPILAELREWVQRLPS